MMTSLSNVEAKLPPGFRFHPRDDELVCDYLVKWMSGFPHSFPSLIEVDLNKCEPWDIPESACVGGKEWYFYSLRDRKYATGLRTNRATVSGYWKATGKDRPITRKGALVGMRKTLVFYQGRAPKGRKTDWVMHEFRIQGSFGPSTPKIIPPAKGDWVLCRVFFKSRSENSGKQEAADDATASSPFPCPSPSLPGLMEPSPYITFEQTQEEACASDHNNNSNHYHHEQQVPCFSILSPNIPHHMDPPPPPHMLPKTSFPNNFGAEKPSNLGFYDSSSAYYDHKSTMRAFLSHLTKIENDQHPPNNVMMLLKGSSPSLGEGSSDCSYLSDVAAGGLSSVWNQYA